MGKVDAVITERDSKSIARQWNREIEDETRRLSARRDRGPWRAVVWGALWLLWLALLGLTIAVVRPLHW